MARRLRAGAAPVRSSAWALILVATVHLGYEPAAAWLFPDARVAAGKAIFYILRGFEGVALWCAVLVLARGRSPALVVACVWGAVESAQTALCRLALPMGGAPPVAPAFGGICDVAAGFPVAGVMAAVVLVALSIVQECGRARR